MAGPRPGYGGIPASAGNTTAPGCRNRRPPTTPAFTPTLSDLGARLDWILKWPALGPGTAVFLLQPVIPPRLGVGIVDQRQHRLVPQPFLLSFHDVAALPQEGTDIGPQHRPQRAEPRRIPIDAVVDLGRLAVDGG